MILPFKQKLVSCDLCVVYMVGPCQSLFHVAALSRVLLCACASAGLSLLILFACGLKLLLYTYHGHSEHLGLILRNAGELFTIDKN